MGRVQTFARFAAAPIATVFRLATLAVEIVGLTLTIRLSNQYNTTSGILYAAVGSVSSVVEQLDIADRDTRRR